MNRRTFSNLAMAAAAGGTGGAAAAVSQQFPGKISIVMIAVKQLPRALEFYRSTLGMKFTNQIEDELAFLDAGGVQLCLSAPLANASPGVGGTELVFPVDHVRSSYEWLRSRGVSFTHEPRNITGSSWVANFSDPDGHALSISGPE